MGFIAQSDGWSMAHFFLGVGRRQEDVLPFAGMNMLICPVGVRGDLSLVQTCSDVCPGDLNETLKHFSVATKADRLGLTL